VLSSIDSLVTFMGRDVEGNDKVPSICTALDFPGGTEENCGERQSG
jgi:hypothetical protein